MQNQGWNGAPQSVRSSSPVRPPLNSFHSIARSNRDDTALYRVDTARDGRAFTKQSFLERYGEGEGLARWKAAPPADGTHVSGLGLNCASAGCGRESEAYCHDCKESFCSYACLCTWHRKKRAKNHNRITYTLSGARRLTEGSESYSPRKTIEELQPRINDLEHQKQMAVQTEDYSSAQRLKEMIEQLHNQGAGGVGATYHTVLPTSSPMHQAAIHQPFGAAYSQPIVASQSPPPPQYQPPGPWAPRGAWSM